MTIVHHKKHGHTYCSVDNVEYVMLGNRKCFCYPLGNFYYQVPMCSGLVRTQTRLGEQHSIIFYVTITVSLKVINKTRKR